MAKYLMAMDAGTGSVRAVIFSTEGDQVGCVQKEWTHNEDPRWPGSMDFDWTTNWELARTCVSEVLAKTGIDASDIAAVSTTCMREGILLYDKDGKEIWSCANVDARSNDEVGELIAMNPDLERPDLRPRRAAAPAVGQEQDARGLREDRPHRHVQRLAHLQAHWRARR